MPAPARERRLADRNGQLVHAFSVEAGNLGLNRLAELIVSMLDSNAWLDWADGLGKVQLLPGEFDYFLSMCGVTRESVMHGVRDVAVKARLEQAMDERRVGEDGYRRRYDELKAVLGQHRSTQPYGYTKTEAKTLDGAFQKSPQRAALGAMVRRYVTTGTTKAPSQQRSKVEQLQASIKRLSEDELQHLADWLTEYRQDRNT
jgi:hypothetical protein